MTLAQPPSEPTSSTAVPGPVPWARQSTATQERVTARVRRVVQDLPAWEPTPPGEITVRRTGSV
jgi:hypothetical protein